MTTRIIKYQSFGSPLLERNKEYICKKEWDKDISLQCGDRGVVLRKSGGYRTAFFEVFTKEDFVRGEGETLEIAEEKAFEKLLKIKNCINHVFERENDSVNAECSLCHHKEKRYFPPTSKCNKCGMDHARLKIKDESLCVKHYMEKAKNMDLSINDSVIKKIKMKIFNEIQEGKNENKDIIILMVSNNDDKIKSYEDIQDDDFRVEMILGEIEEISQNSKLLNALIELGINKEYNEEYKFIYQLEDLKDINYMTCCSKALEAVKKTVNLMVEKNIIKGEADIIDYRYTQKNSKILEEIIDFFKCYSVSLKIEKKYNINNEKVIELIFGKSINEKQNELMSELTNDITKFFHKNENKVNFRKMF